MERELCSCGNRKWFIWCVKIYLILGNLGLNGSTLYTFTDLVAMKWICFLYSISQRVEFRCFLFPSSIYSLNSIFRRQRIPSLGRIRLGDFLPVFVQLSLSSLLRNQFKVRSWDPKAQALPSLFLSPALFPSSSKKTSTPFSFLY